jgi:uncharacterized protein (DUF58 family)
MGSVALAAGMKGNNLLFALFSLLLGIAAVSALLTFVTARRIEVSRLLPETVHAGDVFAATVRFRNAKRMWPAFALRFEDRLTHEGVPSALQPLPVWLPFARAGERVRGTVYLSAPQRGWAKLGPFTVVSEFPPGLFTYRLVLPVEDPLLVLPRPATLNRRVLNPHLARSEYADACPVAYASGDDEFAGLRDYRPGDPPRRIHWKMSARRQGRFLVREFEDAKVRDACILLETFVPNPGDMRRRGRLERAVTFAGALAEALLEQDCRVRFRAFAPEPAAVDLEPQAGAAAGLLRTLALLKPSRVHPLGDLLTAEPEAGREVYFVLRIGDDPLPPWEPLRRSVVIEPSEMKRLMVVP